MVVQPQVRCVLFDAVGTLIFADPPVSTVYRVEADKFGLTLDEATVKRRFARAFAEHNDVDDRSGYLTSDGHERDRWRAIVTDVFPEIALTEALFQRLWQHFARPTSWRLYKDAADCWLRLSRRDLRLGIASNFDDRLLAIARGLPPLDTSPHTFVSSQLGFRKPAREFFAAIEKALGLQPHELLLVGDDWENDYLAAGSAGWQSAHLDRDRRAARVSPLASPPPASIRSLAELS